MEQSVNRHDKRRKAPKRDKLPEPDRGPAALLRNAWGRFVWWAIRRMTR